jgi:hypothetical protein
MTRHDVEAWLDHHIDQTVLVEWRTLDGGVIESKISATGPLHKESGEYLAGDAPIDLTDFEAADFANEGVLVELVNENVELYIALS